MTSRVTIVRHAPTEYNKQNIFMGTKDIPADKFDEIKIKELQKRLSEENYSAVFSSPLRRAIDTAKKTLGKDCGLIIDERLTERCLGDWQGLKREEVQKQYVNAFKNGIMDFYYTPNNGEDYMAMISRIADFICDCYKGNTHILVFTHNGVFRVMKSLLTGEPMGNVFKEYEPFLIPQTFYIDNKKYDTIKNNPFYTVDI